MTRDEEHNEVLRIRALRDDVDHRLDVSISKPSACQCISCRIGRSIRDQTTPKDTTRDAEDAELMAGRPMTLRECMEAEEPAGDLGTNPKDLIGATKAPLGVVPWGAVVQVAPVFADGAAKYGPFNWRDYKVQRMTYIEAALRHLFADIDGQTLDPETGLPHLAHAVAGLMILLDASSMGMSVDNRPTPGIAAELIALQTKKV